MSTLTNPTPQRGQCWREKDLGDGDVWHVEVKAATKGHITYAYRGKQLTHGPVVAQVRQFLFLFEPCPIHPPLPPEGGAQ